MSESLGLTSHKSSCNCTGCGMLRAGVCINCAEKVAALILESGPRELAVEPCSGACREAIDLYFSTPPERWRAPPISRDKSVHEPIVRRPAHPRRLVGVLVIGRVAAKPQAQLASAPEGSVILGLSLGGVGKLISAPRPKVTAAERQV